MRFAALAPEGAPGVCCATGLRTGLRDDFCWQGTSTPFGNDRRCFYFPFVDLVEETRSLDVQNLETEHAKYVPVNPDRVNPEHEIHCWLILVADKPCDRILRMQSRSGDRKCLTSYLGYRSESPNWVAQMLQYGSNESYIELTILTSNVIYIPIENLGMGIQAAMRQPIGVLPCFNPCALLSYPLLKVRKI